MPSTREEILTALDGEKAYQRSRWPDAPHTRSIDEWVLYIGVYAQDAAQQTTKGDEVAVLHTIRKIAALCHNAMEQHGAPRREGF